jgi:hypothetical protein
VLGRLYGPGDGKTFDGVNNAPARGQEPTMDGFVTDYISTLTAELGRQPTYEEYSQVMTGFTPEQIPSSAAWPAGSACCTPPSRVPPPQPDPRCRTRSSGACPS